MTTLKPATRRRVFIPTGRSPADESVRCSSLKRRGWLYGLLVLLLAGYLLFCHGCHGDEDTELFAPTGAAPPSAAAA